MNTLVRVLSLSVLLSVAGVAWAGEGWPEWLSPVPEGARVEVPELSGGVPSPREVLGYRLGERFTRWGEARGYLAELAEHSPRVAMWEYGRSYQGQPLVLLAVSSQRNLGRLEEIRRARLRLAEPEGLAGAERDQLERETPAVVWLGYGIHGNESSSMEAALGTAYVLAAAGGVWAERLERVVVLIDPLQNPDGRERYVGAYQQLRGSRPNPDPEAAEHREPWPGGRGNHYLFDLNRDWAWATQRETRHRLDEYRRWEPQVFVDVHEMGARSAYFFPPSAEPVHPAIDPAVVGWLETFGRANAAAFDRAGWLYFKAEGFDLYYPGYGDSYPSLRGAVGMTYEVGGGGRAGEALTLPDGSLLTLASRTARHLTTSLATVATAADGEQELDAGFVAGRLAQAASAPVTYLWPADGAEAEPLARLLARHGVRVGRLTAAESLAARRIGGGGAAAPVGFGAGTWAATTAQPLGRLVHALLEADAGLPPAYVERQRDRVERNLEAEFFDVTAWSLPLAFHLEAWVHDGLPASLRPADPGFEPEPTEDMLDEPLHGVAGTGGGPGGAGTGSAVAGGEAAGEAPLGWLIPWRGVAGYRVAARLIGQGIPLRVALAPVTTAGGSSGDGTLLAPRLGAPADLDRRIAAAAEGTGAGARPVGASFGGGLSIGSNRVAAVVPPRLGLIGGEGASPTAFGALWHLLDRELGIAVSRLDADRLGRADLAGFTALLLPDGDWSRALDGAAGDELAAWVRGGGVLIAERGALDWLRERKLTVVKPWPAAKDEEGSGTGAGDPESPGDASAEPPDPLAQRLLATPGAVLATRLTPGHPLAAGLPSAPPLLFAGDRVWLPTGDPQVDVLTAAADDPVTAGFAWPEARERLAGSLLVASEAAGEGRVILFAQPPAFRGFWRATMPLLLNAVLYAPSWGIEAY
jgi:hypothetical protein